MRKSLLVLLLPALSVGMTALGSQSQSSSRRLPGGSANEGFLLPNGWRITPAGQQTQVGDLPLALVLHPDGRHALVSNCGDGDQSIDVLDEADAAPEIELNEIIWKSIKGEDSSMPAPVRSAFAPSRVVEPAQTPADKAVASAPRR